MMTRLIEAITVARASLMALAFLLTAVMPAAGQLVVYEMDFKRTDGFNDRPFLGGYFVAPVTGGTGSFVFTQQGTGGLSVVPVNDGGRLFRAITDKGEQKWVAQAQVGGTTAPAPVPDEGGEEGEEGTDTGTGTGGTGTEAVNVSTGSFLAVGEANFNATFRTPLVKFETRIARMLEGRTITASSGEIEGSDKKIGFVSRGDWKLRYDEKQTGIVNREDLDLAAATAYLEGLFTGGGSGPVDSTLRIVSTSPLPTGTAGTAYSVQLNGSGGTGSRSWSLATLSTLPPGLTLSATGLISGTPTTVGTSSFSVVLQDSASPPQTVSRSFSLTVNPAFAITTVSPLPAATNGTAYVATLTATGNAGAVTWSVVGGSPLPTGLTLDAGTGQISGTPTENRSPWEFTIQARDTGVTPNRLVTKNFQLTVSGP